MLHSWEDAKGEGEELFAALPTRVRAALKHQPRHTRTGSGKAKVAHSLEHHSGITSFKRRKTPRTGSSERGRGSRSGVGKGTGGASGAGRRSAGAVKSPTRQSRRRRNGKVPDERKTSAHSPRPRSSAKHTSPRAHSKRSRIQAGAAAVKSAAAPKQAPMLIPAFVPPPQPPIATPPAHDLAGVDLLQLQAELTAHLEAVQQATSRRKAAAQHVIKLVTDAAQQQFPWLTVRCYGSFASDLWLPTSDVDLVALARTRQQADAAPPALEVLRRLHEAVKGAAWLGSSQLVASQVPVLKLKPVNGVDVDLTFAVGATAANPSTRQHNGAATLAVVRQLCASLPLLRPLAMLLKQLLREHGLNEPYTGGLSSYATVLLAAGYLCTQPGASPAGPVFQVPDAFKHLRPGELAARDAAYWLQPGQAGYSYSPQYSSYYASQQQLAAGDVSKSGVKQEGGELKAEQAGLAQHLLQLLAFYGSCFAPDASQLVVCCGRLAVQPKPGLCSQPTLVVEDPLSPGSNVAASAFRFSRVAQLFEDSADAVRHFKATAFMPSMLSCLITPATTTSGEAEEAGYR